MSIIVGYRRTGFGRLLGGLSRFPATTLGAHALTACLSEAHLDPSDVDIVIAGQVLQAGAGQNPARQTAVQAGIPLTTPAITINALCLSGMEAITQAHRLISAGEASIVACVGQESMSLAPHLLMNSRVGTKYGGAKLIDSMELDGLTDAFEQCSMGYSTEKGNTELGLERADQDSWAALSHQRATANGSHLEEEIAPLVTRQGGSEIPHAFDEGIRPETTVHTLGNLKPAFDEQGTITAGNASQISDGAACVIVMSEDEFLKRNLAGLAKILSHSFVAGPTTYLHSQPSRAILKALDRIKKSPSDLDLIEINEAFAAVVLQSIKDLGVSHEIVNQYGGAIALGHPIGVSGTRITGSLAMQLKRLGSGRLGAAGICGGGGQGSALVLESL